MSPSPHGDSPAKPKKGKAKAQSKAKPKQSKASRRGDTSKARKRAEGLIDPNLKIVTKDPLRVQIIAIATQRPTSPSEFSREAGIALNVASYQFKVLREHGFLEIIDEVPVRGGTKRMHIATKSGFISDADWGQVEQALRPGVAGAILQDFNGRVSQAMQAGTFFERDDACLFWAPRNYDEIAWNEQNEIIAWCIEESKRLEVETVERVSKGESKDSFPSTFAIASFPSPTTQQIRKAKGNGKRRKRKTAQGRGKKSSAKGPNG